MEREIIMAAIKKEFDGLHSCARDKGNLWKARLLCSTGPIVWAELSNGAVNLSWNHGNVWQAAKVTIILKGQLSTGIPNILG